MGEPSPDQVRVALAQGMLNVTVMLGFVGGLSDRYDHASVDGLRGALHECYGHLGNLLAAAAPWRQEAAVLVPEDEGESNGREAVAAGS